MAYPELYPEEIDELLEDLNINLPDDLDDYELGQQEVLTYELFYTLQESLFQVIKVIESNWHFINVAIPTFNWHCNYSNKSFEFYLQVGGDGSPIFQHKPCRLPSSELTALFNWVVLLIFQISNNASEDWLDELRSKLIIFFKNYFDFLRRISYVFE